MATLLRPFIGTAVFMNDACVPQQPSRDVCLRACSQAVLCLGFLTMGGGWQASVLIYSFLIFLFLKSFSSLFPQRHVWDSLLVAGLCRPQWDGGAVPHPCGLHHWIHQLRCAWRWLCLVPHCTSGLGGCWSFPVLLFRLVFLVQE